MAKGKSSFMKDVEITSYFSLSLAPPATHRARIFEPIPVGHYHRVVGYRPGNLLEVTSLSTQPRTLRET